MATWSAPVRYAETDQQGIVFNAHYLAYADEACTAWFAGQGVPYDVLLARGLDIRVKAAGLDWSAPVRYGDLLVVDVDCDRVGRTSFVLAARMRVADRLCCTVRLTYVLVDGQGVPVPVPADLRSAWAAPPDRQPEALAQR